MTPTSTSATDADGMTTRPDPPERTILWRRIDQPGHEAARLIATPDGWHLAGTAVFAHEGRPCHLAYEVRTDRDWRTTGATVTGWVGSEAVDARVEADAHGAWMLNGAPVPEVAGCIDVDRNFSPSTALLPIRRLALGIATRLPRARHGSASGPSEKLTRDIVHQ